ncbi:CotH kinase family protein [Candidatus Poribacteria bacterium]
MSADPHSRFTKEQGGDILTGMSGSIIKAMDFQCGEGKHRTLRENYLDSRAEVSEQSANTESGIFDTEKIAAFYITISPEDWAKMQPEHQNASRSRQPKPPVERRFEYTRGSVSYANRIYHNVGIRFKGNSSLRGSRNILKKPFLLDFGHFVKDQTCCGHRKLNFSNGFKDPSLMREKIAYDLFQKAGVPAPRAGYAKLYLTVEGRYCQEYLGLYTVVEHIDEHFLIDRFGNGNGLLIEIDHLPDLVYLGAEWEHYSRNFELRSAREISDTDGLIQFVRFLHNSDDGQFAQMIADLMNVNSFLRFLAVNVVLANVDSYLGTGHNYFLYQNTESGRYEMIPLDLNEAFGNFRMGNAQQMLDLDIHRPTAGRKVLVDRLLNIRIYKAQYIQCLTDLIETNFRVEAIYEQIDHLYGLIRDAVVADKHKLYSTILFEESIHKNVTLEHQPPLPQPGNQGEHKDQRRHRPPPMQVIGLKPFVTKRIESIEAQLRDDRRGYIIHQGMKRPGGKA